ncbi:GlsB/YeaQ/YmgE family stress response membrane protein [Frankia sp. CNm7]|uniref:GlsB/YeaQ/YmgE family stress response membrane protein n=1 Tax=Frankia nepalensis TaxID=1836974 RepID=A0A937RHU2_9ACTN|nr:GlsB/YeaQ/YmgE family stress response membrane protein [Frankia nepalensis]MBL7501775.1 GlsB/YeaQ/YmgE family stress response membrane protein [Frankia nepalensis]MBL7515168.1 GlsB/YeaQ/YmgE family stress response membrane protein [Frankia nepalensis]MBL7524269.1 GlsB/YeaQ/YmgE family stress response membrane protein [Frankia nepalensis]MBL7629245.1 GlsB/YeaQ/YmgE family stress response membrane protein [Frankia nepalensis]
MFQVIGILISGLIIGVVARMVLRGKQNIPIWLTVVAGIIGALIGNTIASIIDVRDTDGFDWIRHILQIAAAAVAVLVLERVWAARRPRRSRR